MKKKWRLLLRRPDGGVWSATVWTNENTLWFEARQACIILHGKNFVDLVSHETTLVTGSKP
jgi:hypothetical protein